MWAPRYKQRCNICKKNMVLIISRRQFPICAQCQMKEINKPIEDKTFKKLFDIDQKLYEQSSFLRNIKANYLRFGNLSDKQIEMFKKVIDELKKEQKESPKTEAGETPLSKTKEDKKEHKKKTKR